MAGLPFPVVDTVAVEIIEQIDALASVLTRVSVAFVHINITQIALPAVWAEALE